jgi:enoyl-CoA hydratase/carnithine racemase
MSQLIISREERVLRLTLNNPEQRNVLNEQLCRDLGAAILDAGQDQSVGALLLDAAGSAFCAGADMDEALLPDVEERTEIHESLFRFGLHYHKPVVAAVQGLAAGLGIGLVANCHVAVAAMGTQFALTEIRCGMWPFVTWRSISSALGERRATELALTGRSFGVNEALQYGLIHEIAPAMELEDRALALAHLLAHAGQESMRRGLDFVRKSRPLNFEQAGQLALEMRAKTYRSADFVEGTRAFRERRKPNWPSLKSSGK